MTQRKDLNSVLKQIFNIHEAEDVEVEEEFDINDIDVIGPAKGDGDAGRQKGKSQKGKGSKGDKSDKGSKSDDSDENGDEEGEEEDAEGEEEIDVEEELERQSGDDHRHHGEEGDEEDSKNQKEVDEEELEEHNKKVERHLKRAAEREGDPNAEASAKSNQNVSPSSSGGGRGSTYDPTARKVDYSNIHPRFKWKTLLDRLVKSADTLEVTYQKPHRRNVTGMHVAAQTGAGVLRPGEKLTPANLSKLVFVVDSSGSMTAGILKVLAELQALFRQSHGQIAKNFIFVEFSGSHSIWSATIDGRTGQATQIGGISEIKSPKGKTIPIDELMSRHIGGATNFSDDLVSDLKPFLAQKFNVLVMTDSDILYGGNWTAFTDLYKEFPSQVYLILDRHETFVEVAKKGKGISSNFTHF
jgi:hypothetical protein